MLQTSKSETTEVQVVSVLSHEMIYRGTWLWRSRSSTFWH